MLNCRMKGEKKYHVMFAELIGKKERGGSVFTPTCLEDLSPLLLSLLITLVNRSAPFHLKRVLSYVE